MKHRKKIHQNNIAKRCSVVFLIFERTFYFLLSSSVFIIEFEHPDDGWECYLHDFNDCYTSDHQ